MENVEQYPQEPQFDNGTGEQGYNQFQTPNGSDWRAGLPPELQSSMQKFNDPESLARAYTGLQGLVGKKSEHFSPQDWQNYYSTMAQMNGIPTSYNQYELDTNPNDEGKINTFTAEDEEAFKQISHNLGLNNEQAQGLYDVFNDIGNQIIQGQEQYSVEYINTNMEELEKDWGNASETKLRAVDHCVNNILPQLTGVSAERIKQEVYESGACNSALLMKIFASIGSLGMESSSYGYNNIAPMDSNIRLEQLRNDPDWVSALTNKHHPNHARATEEHRTLIHMKNGGR